MVKAEAFLFGDRVTVACSGGIDSVAVAHFLSVKMNINVELFHFNHQFSEQNYYMHEAVLKLAEFLKLNIIFRYRDLYRFPINHGDSVENVLRWSRISAIKNTLIGNVILAHHLNDCVESYFLNWLRGHADRDPIPVKTQLNASCSIIRPFLLVTKQDLIDYIEENDLIRFVVEDNSNYDTKHLRNWARHEILPKIKQVYPGLEKVVKKKVLEQYKKERKNEVQSYIG